MLQANNHPECTPENPQQELEVYKKCSTFFSVLADKFLLNSCKSCFEVPIDIMVYIVSFVWYRFHLYTTDKRPSYAPSNLSYI